MQVEGCRFQDEVKDDIFIVEGSRLKDKALTMTAVVKTLLVCSRSGIVTVSFQLLPIKTCVDLQMLLKLIAAAPLQS